MHQFSASLMMTQWQRLRELLRNCSKKLRIDEGKQIHAASVKMGFGYDIILNNDLINLYGKCGRMDMASQVFDRMLERNVVSWTALMCGHLQQGNPKASLSLFNEMTYSDVKPNEFSFSTNFKACGYLNNPVNGMQIHGLCVKNGFEWSPVVCNSIIDMYARYGRITEAEQMFNLMPLRCLISWNVMIAGFSLVGMFHNSLIFFLKMQKHGQLPDQFTFTSTFKACGGLGAIKQGTQIHAYLILRGFPLPSQTIVGGALIDLYVKCGHLDAAHQVFDQLEQKSIVSLSALIQGYAQEGNLIEAMDLFSLLRENNVQVDGVVLSTVIAVFADFALVEQGKQMHCYTVKVPSGLDASVGNSILDMYLKCGLTEEAERHFTEMPERNVVSWTVLITGYGKHGLGNEAVYLFGKMQIENVEPDGVTYLALLSACSHSGLIEESREYFSRLCEHPQIRPQVEHYACMVDLLARAGYLEEAKKLIEKMPMRPDIGIWQTLLSACRVHGDMEMGKEVGERVLRLDSDNPTNYVMISNIYANAGFWTECERVRKTVKSKGLKKDAGCSWVEIDKKVHIFYNADERRPLAEEIRTVLKEMEKRIKEEVGYIYDVRFALYDVEEESKAESLKFHSEKLAIGLALVHSGIGKGGRMIRIFKNLRVCGDCHSFIKGLSKVLQKVFVVRDANRFHKFEDGLCSCRDYW